MTSNQNFEQMELFDLAQINRSPVDAYEISSQLEEMKHGVLATLARKLSLTLIPNVRFRVVGKHTKIREEEAQRGHNKKMY